MKILVFASDNRPLCNHEANSDYNSLTAYINYLYCKKHGYDFIYFQPYLDHINPGNLHISPNSHGPPRHVSWAKLLSTIKGMKLGLYDYVVYIDTDCIFKNWEVSIEYYIEKYKEDNLIFISNAPWHPSLPCADFFIAKVSLSVIQMIAAWYDYKLPDNKSLKWKQTLDIANRENKFTWNVGTFWEQDALWIMIQTLTNVVIVPKEVAFVETENQFIRHICSAHKANRKPYFSDFVKKLEKTYDAFDTVINAIHVIPYDTNQAFSEMLLDKM